MKDLSANFERHEAGPGVGLLKGLGVSLDSGSFSFDKPEECVKTRLLKEHFIQSPTIDSPLLDHFKGSEKSNRNCRNGYEDLENYLRWKVRNPSELQEVVKIAEITPELLQSEDWKSAEFRPYDVSLEASMPRSGRSHPMQALIERIRSIFLEMGFSELVDDYVQTAGWNMDALFIPQDHPAREMQDTFYLDNPKQIRIWIRCY